jgi:hypothetical protein
MGFQRTVPADLVANAAADQVFTGETVPTNVSPGIATTVPSRVGAAVPVPVNPITGNPVHPPSVLAESNPIRKTAAAHDAAVTAANNVAGIEAGFAPAVAANNALAVNAVSPLGTPTPLAAESYLPQQSAMAAAARTAGAAGMAAAALNNNGVAGTGMMGNGGMMNNGGMIGNGGMMNNGGMMGSTPTSTPVQSPFMATATSLAGMPTGAAGGAVGADGLTPDERAAFVRRGQRMQAHMQSVAASNQALETLRFRRDPVADAAMAATGAPSLDVQTTDTVLRYLGYAFPIAMASRHGIISDVKIHPNRTALRGMFGVSAVYMLADSVFEADKAHHIYGQPLAGTAHCFVERFIFEVMASAVLPYAAYRGVATIVKNRFVGKASTGVARALPNLAAMITVPIMPYIFDLPCKAIAARALRTVWMHPDETVIVN